MGTECKPCKYVWFKNEDKSRNPYAAFRRSFKLSDASKVKHAKINIFADTVYALYINGKFTGFGPVRFDPRFPQYDTYDIKEHLTDGDNVIAILVNFHGHKVFKSVPEQAALIAWGEVDTGNDKDGVIDLRTGADSSDSTCNGAWKCKEHTGHSRFTAKLSFALNAQIHYEQGHISEDWMKPGFDDSDWDTPVVITDQNTFGSQTPREIPFMELTAVQPSAVTITPLLKTEDIHSFYIPLPIKYATAFEEPETFSRFLCWSTYIYSPQKQQVTAGVLYESLWLNGNACSTKEDPFKPLRYNTVLSLEEGWNYLFVHVNVFQDIYEGYLALPGNKGLVISAEKDIKGELLFRFMSLQPIELDEKLRDILLPMPEDIDMSPYGGWNYTTKHDIASGPCREASWDTYTSPLQTLTPDTVSGFTADKSTYPDGFMLVFDMDHMRLVFPRLRFSGGLKGAIVDFIYADRYSADGQHLV